MSDPQSIADVLSRAADAWPKCLSCGKAKLDIKQRRQNTSYVQDNLNWVVCCLSCFEERQEYWADQWSDCYSGLL